MAYKHNMEDTVLCHSFQEVCGILATSKHGWLYSVLQTCFAMKLDPNTITMHQTQEAYTAVLCSSWLQESVLYYGV